MQNIYKIKGKLFKKHKMRYIKISKNQLRILESLYQDGSKDKKYFDSKKKLRYSEHSGLLDFGKSTLQRIIINAKQNISDKLDENILLPDNMIDAIDFEYMFHTHPATPKFGSRIDTDGVLYEFPSISDLFHFSEHYNIGKTQGSIIISPEGIYIIKAINNMLKINTRIMEDNYLEDELFKIHDLSIIKYNKNIKKIFKKIINDDSFINKYNTLIKPYNLKIFYKSRIKINNKWILDDLYLKVQPIE